MSNTLKRYRMNSQLFMRQGDWSYSERFYKTWARIRKEQAIAKRYRDQPNAGTW